jgi:hypothetical protein
MSSAELFTDLKEAVYSKDKLNNLFELDYLYLPLPLQGFLE